MKRKISIGGKASLCYTSVHTQVANREQSSWEDRQSTCCSFLLLSASVFAQDRTVDPTWLHRFLPNVVEVKADLTSATCHNRTIFGAGNSDDRILRSVSHFAEVTIDAHGSCQSVQYDRQEEIYFVTQGTGLLQLGDETRPLRANDFTYLAPGVKHGISNNAEPGLARHCDGLQDSCLGLRLILRRSNRE